MNIPPDLRYTKDHEWLKAEGATALVGITDYAQHELGDIVFVEMPKIGAMVEQAKPCANIEAVKAVSPLYAPASGNVIDVNKALESSPQLINQDPYGKGWILKVQLSSPKELDTLLSAQEYQKLIGA